MPTNKETMRMSRFNTFRRQRPHLFLMFLMMGLALLFISPATWLVLTISGLAMGAMLFLMASGMSLTFGLMSVLNLAHGAFISVGAYAGAMALTWLFTGYSHSESLLVSLAVIVPAFLLAAALAGLLGLVFERLVIRPVYGDHLKHILVTVGEIGRAHV